MRQATHRSARSGFTIVEVIVIVVILGIIAAVIAPRLFQRVGQSKQAVAKANAESLASNVRLFIIDHGMPDPGSPITILSERPANVDEAAWNAHGSFVNNVDDLKDPWGNFYVLIIPGQVNVDFDIVSYGKDGQPGGEGGNADVVNGKK